MKTNKFRNEGLEQAFNHPKQEPRQEHAFVQVIDDALELEPVHKHESRVRKCPVEHGSNLKQERALNIAHIE